MKLNQINQVLYQKVLQRQQWQNSSQRQPKPRSGCRLAQLQIPQPEPVNAAAPGPYNSHSLPQPRSAAPEPRGACGASSSVARRHLRPPQAPQLLSHRQRWRGGRKGSGAAKGRRREHKKQGAGEEGSQLFGTSSPRARSPTGASAAPLFPSFPHSPTVARVSRSSSL